MVRTQEVVCTVHPYTNISLKHEKEVIAKRFTTMKPHTLIYIIGVLCDRLTENMHSYSSSFTPISLNKIEHNQCTFRRYLINKIYLCFFYLKINPAVL